MALSSRALMGAWIETIQCKHDIINLKAKLAPARQMGESRLLHVTKERLRMKALAKLWKGALFLALASAAARLAAYIFRPGLIVRYGILIANIASSALSISAIALTVICILLAIADISFTRRQEAEESERFMKSMLASQSESIDENAVAQRIKEQMAMNPSLKPLLEQAASQMGFVDVMAADFSRIFAGAKEASGVHETILDELEKDRYSILGNIDDILRWAPSPSVARHYESHVGKMKESLARNEAIMARYEDIKYAALEYLENKRARPDRDIGIDSLYEAIKSLAEHEKPSSFPGGTGT